MQTRHRISPSRTASVGEVLTALVAEATSAQRVTLDEHYELTAFVVERGAEPDAQTIVVELIDHGPDHGDDRWTLLAYDELNGRSSGLINGPTAHSAITATPWSEL